MFLGQLSAAEIGGGVVGGGRGEEEDDGLQLTLLGAGLQGGDAVLEFGDRVGFLRETSQCVSKQSARAEPASTQHDIV